MRLQSCEQSATANSSIGKARSKTLTKTEQKQADWIFFYLPALSFDGSDNMGLTEAMGENFSELDTIG